MPDAHPHNFEIEIDRPGLTAYLRFTWFINWLTVSLLVGLMGGLIGATADLRPGVPNPGEPSVGKVVQGIAVGLAIAVPVGGLLYLLLGHGRAARSAAGLRVSVEGAYLRIQKGIHFRTDQKIHFRAVSEFCVVEGPLMRRLGVAALIFQTMGRGPQVPYLRIVGVKDCHRTRDLLTEVDKQREGL